MINKLFKNEKCILLLIQNKIKGKIQIRGIENYWKILGGKDIGSSVKVPMLANS